MHRGRAGNFTWPAQCARKAVSQDCVRFQHASAQPHLGCWCCTWADSADSWPDTMVWSVYHVVPASVYRASVCAGGMVSPWSSQYPDMLSEGHFNDRESKRSIGSVVFERSTWRFAAGFDGTEESLTWHRDPQYRRCAPDFSTMLFLPCVMMIFVYCSVRPLASALAFMATGSLSLICRTQRGPLIRSLATILVSMSMALEQTLILTGLATWR